MADKFCNVNEKNSKILLKIDLQKKIKIKIKLLNL